MKTITRCPKCGGPETDSDPACKLCHGTGICAELAVADVERVAETATPKLFSGDFEQELLHKAKLLEGIPYEVYKRVFNRLQVLRLKHCSYRDDELLTLLLCQDNVDRVAAEDYAKKLDELTAENEDLKRRLDVLHHHAELPASDEPYEIPQAMAAVVSAVERAMCKVSGPAQAALLALAIELRRRGT